MKTVFIYFSVLLLCLFVGLSSVDAGWDEGVAAYKYGHYETAFKEFKPLAEQGNAQAMLGLGMIYYNGRGVPKDYVMAYMWYYLAETQGSEEAIINRSIVVKEMTTEQISEAERLSREFEVKKP